MLDDDNHCNLYVSPPRSYSSRPLDDEEEMELTGEASDGLSDDEDRMVRNFLLSTIHITDIGSVISI